MVAHGLEQEPLILSLLGDRVWWVRYRAGQGLLRLTGMTEARLDELRESLADPYAQDMLEQVRAEAALP